MASNPNSDFERFRTGAEKYASYLQTPEGRLRLDLTFANLQDFLPPGGASLRALDLGCGTGAMAIRLAGLGFTVTGLDASQEMLEIAQQQAREAGHSEKIDFLLGDISQPATLLRAESFDVVLCHNLLEFVDDPATVIRMAARALRGPLGMISILVRNRPGEVLKAALLNGNLAAADRNLTAEWGDESLYGGKVRLFEAKKLRAMVVAEPFTVVAERGVRVISDYLAPTVSGTEEYAQVFELERKLGWRPDFAAVARYSHFLARRSVGLAGDSQ